MRKDVHKKSEEMNLLVLFKMGKNSKLNQYGIRIEQGDTISWQYKFLIKTIDTL